MGSSCSRSDRQVHNATGGTIVTATANAAPPFVSGSVASSPLAKVPLSSALASGMSIQQWADQPIPDREGVALAVKKYERARAHWARSDFGFLVRWHGVDAAQGNAIFDSLGARCNAIRMYRIYARLDGTAVAALATLDEGTEGHRGLVHGGVTALLFDNTLGWANAFSILAERNELAALLLSGDDVKPFSASSAAIFGFTASLTVNYRAPCKCGTTVELLARVDRCRHAFVCALANVEVLTSIYAGLKRREMGLSSALWLRRCAMWLWELF